MGFHFKILRSRRNFGGTSMLPTPKVSALLFLCYPNPFIIDLEPTDTALPFRVDIKTPPPPSFLSPIQPLQPQHSNHFVSPDTALALREMKKKRSYDTALSLPVDVGTLQVNPCGSSRTGDYSIIIETGISYLYDGHTASTIPPLSLPPILIAQQYPYPHIPGQLHINEYNPVVSSVFTNPQIVQEASASRKIPQSSKRDCHGTSKMRRSSLFGADFVNGLSLFLSQSVLDRASNGRLLRQELPYTLLQWILHGAGKCYGRMGRVMLLILTNDIL
jgi:hypothetical protein